MLRGKRPEPLLWKKAQMRAYEEYEQRAKGQGVALEDWLKGEAEVLDRLPNSLPSSSTVVKQL
jgi:hypothetical protein